MRATPRPLFKRLAIATIAALPILGIAACGNSGSASDAVGRSAQPTPSYDAAMGGEGDVRNRNGSINPTPEQTVADAIVKPTEHQAFYLWGENTMPSTPQHSGPDMRSGEDGTNFRPTVVTFPVAGDIKPKGAVLINAGGAFQFRSNGNEGEPVALALNKDGFQCFVVNYRLLPYSQQEAGLDLQRAVRFVREHANDYRIDPNNIAVMGFSAGAILSGEQALHFQGSANGTAVSDEYRPDSLDAMNADVKAVGLIYGFYGRLARASTDVDEFRSAHLPATFMLWGSNDPFVSQYPQSAQALRDAGVSVETHEMDGWPHGFGADGGWIGQYFAPWLTNVFAR